MLETSATSLMASRNWAVAAARCRRLTLFSSVLPDKSADLIAEHQLNQLLARTWYRVAGYLLPFKVNK